MDDDGGILHDGVMIPGFGQPNRTGSYVVLVLIMGAGWFVVVSADTAIAA